MSWGFLILAGVCEMMGVVMINKVHLDKRISSYAGMIVGFVASFIFLAIAMEELPMGIAYAVWTGIGASGSAIIGMLFYGESKDYKRIACIALIISATIGLKFS